MRLFITHNRTFSTSRYGYLEALPGVCIFFASDPLTIYGMRIFEARKNKQKKKDR